MRPAYVSIAAAVLGVAALILALGEWAEPEKVFAIMGFSGVLAVLGLKER